MNVSRRGFFPMLAGLASLGWMVPQSADKASKPKQVRNARDRRLGIVIVSDCHRICRGKTWEQIEKMAATFDPLSIGLPHDTVIDAISPHVRFISNQIVFRIEHRLLPIVKEAHPIPVVKPIIVGVNHCVGWETMGIR